MSWHAPIDLPPSRADRAIGRAMARAANPMFERSAEIVSWLADEKVVLTAAAAIWVAMRCRDDADRREADQMMLSIMIAGVLPHVGKWLVRRRRPDRSLVGGRRNGVPKSGNAWDSFPSGHAVHMGALAGSVARLSPRWLRPVVWPGFAALAASRVMILAHYPSDVIAGWGIGVLINRSVAAVCGAVRRRMPPTASRMGDEGPSPARSWSRLR